MTDIDSRRQAKPSCQGVQVEASISKRRRSRRGAKLWAKDKRGRFRTRGSNSVATTRGTFWLTQERCKGTLTKVYEGAVVGPQPQDGQAGHRPRGQELPGAPQALGKPSR